MDGLLVIDKPSGPTSHDVVARMRRALGETRIGHTGTLDPMATGVLLLVVGQATRLARFLGASDKSYDAVVRFGFATDTADAQGRPIGALGAWAMPARAAIETALDEFRGAFMQQPPAFSAKKIDGQRSYRLARARARGAHAPAVASLPAPARVTTTRIDVVQLDADSVTLRVDCSAGFYVRSLAHDLGDRLGVGAHLAALCRTRSGEFGLDRALSLDAAQADPRRAAEALVPMAGMLPALPAVILTAAGITRIARGQDISLTDRLADAGDPATTTNPEPSGAGHPPPFVRLLDGRGRLLAIAQPLADGALHPSVVLV